MLLLLLFLDLYEAAVVADDEKKVMTLQVKKMSEINLKPITNNLMMKKAKIRLKRKLNGIRKTLLMMRMKTKLKTQ